VLAAAVYGVGATIPGPAIFTVEADPVPRGFALGLVLLALGFAFCGRLAWAAVAGSLALLFQAPLTLPFWMLFAFLAWRERKFRPLIAPLVAAVVLVVLWRLQPAGVEAPAMFRRIDAAWEHILRLRGSYVWVSLWPARLWAQYALLWILAALAARRVARGSGRIQVSVLLFLPTIGVLSLPISWLLLEGAKWSFIPQFQPARYVLFVSLFAQLLALLAGFAAARLRIYWEAWAWILLALTLTAHPDLFSRSWKPPLAAGNVQSPGLDELCRWAESTPRDSMFLFPESGRSLVPGVFRAQAQRALYVDWKAGGQANFFEGLALEWWQRWQGAMNARTDASQLRAAGIDYVVVLPKRPMSGLTPVFQNGSFLAYRLP
jgi:hypothetical protein